MPDLGKYAAEVLAAYGASVLLVAALIGATWWRGRRVKQMLEQVEREQRDG